MKVVATTVAFVACAACALPGLAFANPARFARAIQNPRENVGFAPLKTARPVMGPLGPWSATGRHATALRVEDAAGKHWVVRALSTREASLAHRYQQIVGHLKQRMPELVDELTYQDQGLRSDGEWFPAVMMPYIEGPTLDHFVDRAVKSATATAELNALADRFRGLTGRLERAGVAHGDLQHGNVIVERSGRLRLIDLDGMYVPGLARDGALNVGHPNYRHPARTATDFNATLDHFSALLIYTSLRALAADPSLWRFHNGDNLLLSERDLENPENSEVWTALAQSPSPLVRDLSRATLAFSRLARDSVPRLSAVLQASQRGRLSALVENTETTVGLAPVRPVRSEIPMRVATHRATAPAVRSVARPEASPLPRVSRDNSALLVLMIDNSLSMEKKRRDPASAGMTNATAMANVGNAMLEELVRRNAPNGEVQPRFDVAVVSYGGDAATEVFFYPLPELADHARVFDEVDGEGNIVRRPEWITPNLRRGTPMADGYRKARDRIRGWLANRTGRLVMLVNATDGSSTDGDPRPVAAEIEQLVRARQSTLLHTTVHLTTRTSATPTLFPVEPTWDSKKDRRQARMLFEMASEVPASLRDSARAQGIEIAEGARLMGYNADVSGLARLLRVGTDPALSSE